MKQFSAVDIRIWTPLLIALIIMSLIGAWAVIDSKRHIDNRIKDRLRYWNNAMVKLQQDINLELQLGDFSEAQRLISEHSIDPNLKALAVIDNDQQILLANRYAWKSRPAINALPGYALNLDTGEQKVTMGSLIYDKAKHYVQAYYPVTLYQSTSRIRSSADGILYLYLDMNPELAAVRYQIWEDAKLMIALGLFAIGLFILFLHRFISRPLLLLTQASRELAGGKFTHVALKGKGELAQLASAFNKMSEQLEQSVTEISKKEQMIRLATSAGGIGTWEWDLNTGRVYWSEGVENIFGLEPGEFGDSAEVYKAQFHPDDIELLDNAIRDARKNGNPQHIEHRIIWPDKTQRWIETQGNIECDEHGAPKVMRGTVMDITQRKRAQEEIERLAYYDPLTGLANRRLLLDRLQQTIAGARRNGLCGALIFFDLDRFKVLNDSLGHKAGDLLLQQVAGRLVSSMRREDTISRLGGDEFVVLLPANEVDAVITAHQASRVVEKIRKLLHQRFNLEGHSFQISASIGIAIYPQDGGQASILLNHADAAMYQAKGNGRNAIAFYHPSLQARADARLSLEEALHHALERGEMILFYQAQVDKDKNTVGVEALVRWQQADQSIVPPNEFIPVAEESGQILQLGEWVLLSACRQLHVWEQNRDILTPQLSVNVSPVQFRHSDFVEMVDKVIRTSQINPRMLTLEITEGTLIENLDDTIAKLQALKDLGVRISVDDFGTGYSSLYYLKHLPLDELKIDKAYVQDITIDRNNAAIVETILSMARHLQLEVVAEGVETEAQADFLIANGCKHFQGYLYSRPSPVEVISTQLKTITSEHARSVSH